MVYFYFIINQLHLPLQDWTNAKNLCRNLKTHEEIIVRLTNDEIKFDTTTARIETSLESISSDIQFIKHELIKKAI